MRNKKEKEAKKLKEKFKTIKKQEYQKGEGEKEGILKEI